MKKVLITGCAGFIGFSFAYNFLKKKNYIVYGIDSIDSYYSRKLKFLRLRKLKNKKFIFFKLNIKNIKKLKKKLKYINFDYVFHFAAQAGVRYSLINPKKYLESNILGTLNLLEILKFKKIKKIFIASSSSVYGDNSKLPTKESSKLKPKSFYAESKLITELLGKYYAKIFNLNICILRFFTLYGKWGRPDMFLFRLFKSFIKNNFFYLNNKGNHQRDFTYIDDAIKIILNLMNLKEKKKYNTYNICSSNPVDLRDIISYFSNRYGQIKIKLLNKNKLDVNKTYGSNSKVLKKINFKKKSLSNIYISLNKVFEWYYKNRIYKLS
jgi:UDP-glucuronate 4-epimerase